MKLSYLPEFAALLTAHSELICSEPGRLNSDIVGQLYIAARDRSNRWMSEIGRLGSAEAFTAESLLANRHPMVDLTERILINDLLIRSWSAVLVSVDRANGQNQVESIARNVHLGQMVLRHRVISRVLASTALTPDEVRHVNSIREKVERWTDMLLGQLRPDVQADFAFQPDRAADFANTYRSDESSGPDNHVWRLVLTGLRSAFGNEIPDSSMVSQDDRNVITAILAGLSPAVTQVTRDELGPRIGTLKL